MIYVPDRGRGKISVTPIVQWRTNDKEISVLEDNILLFLYDNCTAWFGARSLRRALQCKNVALQAALRAITSSHGLEVSTANSQYNSGHTRPLYRSRVKTPVPMYHAFNQNQRQNKDSDVSEVLPEVWNCAAWSWLSNEDRAVRHVPLRFHFKGADWLILSCGVLTAVDAHRVAQCMKNNIFATKSTSDMSDSDVLEQAVTSTHKTLCANVVGVQKFCSCSLFVSAKRGGALTFVRCGGVGVYALRDGEVVQLLNPQVPGPEIPTMPDRDAPLNLGWSPITNGVGPSGKSQPPLEVSVQETSETVTVVASHSGWSANDWWQSSDDSAKVLLERIVNDLDRPSCIEMQDSLTLVKFC
jgi:hypothetical protein